MEKLDLKKRYKAYYTAKSVPEIVDIESAQYLSIRGKGDPSGSDFAERISALYATAYTVKFIYKEQGQDFVVSKLEGQWWYDTEAFPAQTVTSASVNIPRSEWEYRLLIRMPEYVTNLAIEDAKDIAFRKKGLPLIKELAYFEMTEGKSVQFLHVGPFSTEPESLAIMADFMESHNLQQNGLHHEIYLSDFRKTAPERLKTILREPVV